jgi:hypothetical protein
MVPALLPPPAPFKLFVLLAGVAEVRPIKFVTSIAVARGLRYLALGVLAIRYGDAALVLMRTRGQAIALWLAGLIVVGALYFPARAYRVRTFRRFALTACVLAIFAGLLDAIEPRHKELNVGRCTTS